MKSRPRFSADKSPLQGKPIPLDWKTMDPTAKRRALVSYGYARDYEHACRLMGQHGAALQRWQRERKAAAAKRRHPEGKD